ncbi:MAG: dihydrofolate reductase, partial [Vicingaceae bacterium]
MKITKYFTLAIAATTVLASCGGGEATNNETAETPIEETNNKSWYTEEYTETDADGFRWKTERFADIKVLRYQINGWDKLTPKQKELVYYITQAGYAGKEIIWDQNYRHNLKIKRALENIVQNFSGDKTTDDWTKFMVYTKRVWFANGIHHHYSMDKFNPDFTREYFATLMADTKTELSEEVLEVIFNPEVDNKKVSLDASKDLLLASASNFYGPDVTEKEVTEFYAAKADKNDPEPISYGLNSKLVRGENGLEEKVWKSGGMYGAAIDQVIGWLEKAVTVAENEAQGNALKLLIEYYKTGDLEIWDQYNVAWASATEGDIDYINSFI